MRIAVKRYREIEGRLWWALTRAGFDVVEAGEPAAVLLSDHDKYRDICEPYERVFLYPHGAGPCVSADGIHPIGENTRGQFTHCRGQVEVLASFGYPLPTADIGWLFCELGTPKPRPCDGPVRVLFAPEHAAWNFVLQGTQEANRRWHDELVRTPGVSLTVRTIGNPTLYGIAMRQGVQYRLGQAATADAVRAIDAADVVVSSPGSFPLLAEARGVPAILFNQGDHADIFKDQDGRVWQKPPDHPELYNHLCAHPIDADGLGLTVALATALERNNTAEGWRRRWIGEPFAPDLFARQVTMALDCWR